MANYLFDLPNDLIEVIYEKKHRAEMADILKTIWDQRKCIRGHYGCVKCTHGCRYKEHMTEKDVGHKWSLYKNTWSYEGDYTLEKILKNTYRFVDSEGNKKNVGRTTKCWSYKPTMRRKITNETMKEKLRQSPLR